MSELLLKLAQPDDLGTISKIENECFVDPWGEQTVMQMIKSPFVKVLFSEQDGEPSSYLVISKSDCVEILKIAVMPKYRRCRLGTECLGYALDEAKETPDKRIILEVRASNEGAISFYKRNGFETDGIRKGYYKNPSEDAILMSLSINETEGR